MLHRGPYGPSSQQTRVRRNRRLLLPLSRGQADRVALQVHASLARLRTGSGDRECAALLGRALVFVWLVAQQGYGDFTSPAMAILETDIGALLERGEVTGDWVPDPAVAQRLGDLVSLFDWQLQRGPLNVTAKASEAISLFPADLQDDADYPQP